jgi:hypothetical protein
MKRLKQTFAERYNRETGRTGHIWGDRYWSRIVVGEPPEGESGAAAVAANTGVRPLNGKTKGPPVFHPFPPPPPPPHPDKRQQSAPRLRINQLSRPRRNARREESALN